MSGSTQSSDKPAGEEKSFFNIIVHSFFVIPFLIAVFCVLLFVAVHLLTRENRSVYDYLEDVKTGGLTKRWQGAFELSKILANPKLLPDDSMFYEQLTSLFEHSQHDDPKVQQYLALALGRTQRKEFLEPLTSALKTSDPSSLAPIIYALGMLEQPEAADTLRVYTNHAEPRIRSIAVAALGNLQNPSSISVLKEKLVDAEPNVQWAAAVALAKLGDNSGEDILKQIMNRNLLKQFPEVDQEEQTNLVLAAIDAASSLDKSQFNEVIKGLSESDPNMRVRSKALEFLK